MILNLLSSVTLFVKNVFDFLVKTTGSTTMAYLSLILVGALAVALVIFTFLAIINSCKRKKTKTTPVCTPNEEEPKKQETNEIEETSAIIEDDVIIAPSIDENCQTEPNETANTECDDATPIQELNATNEEPSSNATQEGTINTTQNKPRRTYDDIPAMPIYRKSKYEKPKTILVKKDKSKLRNPQDQNK